MYDIQIFIEDNWSLWARIQLWDEIIYAIWNTPEELFKEIRSILEDIKVPKSVDKSKFDKIFMCFSNNYAS
jgi:hypothetical protein